MINSGDLTPRLEAKPPHSPRSVTETWTSPLNEKIQESSPICPAALDIPSYAPFPPVKEGIIDEDYVAILSVKMDKEERKIERQLSKLSLNDEGDFAEIDLKELIESLKEIEDWEGPFKMVNPSIEEGIAFLSRLFPEFVLNQMTEEERKERLNHVASLGVTLSSSLQIGAKRLYVICKSKILQRTKSFLKDFKKLYKDIPEPSIKEWEIQIQLEEKKLREEQIYFFVNATSNLFSLMSIPLRFLPQAVLISKLRTHLSSLTAGIQLIGSWIDLAKERGRDHLLRKWSRSFDQLKAHFHPTALIIKGTTSSFQEEASSLFEKRKQGIEKKRAWLNRHFSSIAPKIKSQKREHFLRDVAKIEKTVSLETATSRDWSEAQVLIEKWDLLASFPSQESADFLDALRDLKNKSAQGPIGLQNPLANHSLFQRLQAAKLENQWVDDQVELWFETQSKGALIDDYIDTQETIEIGVKNALNQLIEKKHEMTKALQDFNSLRSHVYFALGMAGFTLSFALAILGLLTIPAGGVGLALLALSLGGSAISLSFLIASYCRDFRYKPQVNQTLTTSFMIQMAYCRFRNSVATYRHLSYEKKLSDVAKILYELDQNPGKKDPKKYQSALESYQKAKAAFEVSERRVIEWNQKIEKFEKTILEAEWRDFAKYSGLILEENFEPFDALQSLEIAMKSFDFNLLSAETRKIFEIYLGIDLKVLQIEMQKNPQAASSAIENFFGLSHSLFFDFIRKQTARMEKGLVQ